MDKEYLIKKWLNNDLSNAETEAFNAMEGAKLYKEIVAEAKRFNGNSNATVESFETLDKKLATKKRTSIHWMRMVSSIAAILVVSFALFTLINKNDINTFNTTLAEHLSITLPDNSMVNLNQLSKLEYNSNDWDENRALTLNGEAYFDVEKGNRFDVNTAFGTISVLGTEFNVLSRDTVFKVSCYEGLVQVTYNNKAIKLPAGTEFKVTSGKGIKSNIAIAEPYWLKNMSVFENAAFAQVVEELEKQFQIKIHYPTHLNVNFTGAFEHDNIENALKSVTKPLNLTYTIQNTNEVIIRDEQN